MIITIDGPAGTGKSTMARRLADALGYQFQDTGTLYRAIAWLSLKQNTDMTNPQALAELAGNVKIELADDHVYVDGTDISENIRSVEVTRQASLVAVIPQIRERLNQIQREIAARGDIVTEGRDQGTVVFPEAECKFYITANIEVRAQRRQRDLQLRGQQIEYSEVLADIEERDYRDASRTTAPLKAAPDAIMLDTSTLTKQEVLEELITKAKKAIVQAEQA